MSPRAILLWWEALLVLALKEKSYSLAMVRDKTRGHPTWVLKARRCHLNEAIPETWQACQTFQSNQTKIKGHLKERIAQGSFSTAKTVWSTHLLSEWDQACEMTQEFPTRAKTIQMSWVDQPCSRSSTRNEAISKSSLVFLTFPLKASLDVCRGWRWWIHRLLDKVISVRWTAVNKERERISQWTALQTTTWKLKKIFRICLSIWTIWTSINKETEILDWRKTKRFKAIKMSLMNSKQPIAIATLTIKTAEMFITAPPPPTTTTIIIFSLSMLLQTITAVNDYSYFLLISVVLTFLPTSIFICVYS